MSFSFDLHFICPYFGICLWRLRLSGEIRAFSDFRCQRLMINFIQWFNKDLTGSLRPKANILESMVGNFPIPPTLSLRFPHFIHNKWVFKWVNRLLIFFLLHHLPFFYLFGDVSKHIKKVRCVKYLLFGLPIIHYIISVRIENSFSWLAWFHRVVVLFGENKGGFFMVFSHSLHFKIGFADIISFGLQWCSQIRIINAMASICFISHRAGWFIIYISHE